MVELVEVFSIGLTFPGTSTDMFELSGEGQGREENTEILLAANLVLSCLLLWNNTIVLSPVEYSLRDMNVKKNQAYKYIGRHYLNIDRLGVSSSCWTFHVFLCVQSSVHHTQIPAYTLVTVKIKVSSWQALVPRADSWSAIYAISATVIGTRICWCSPNLVSSNWNKTREL